MRARDLPGQRDSPGFTARPRAASGVAVTERDRVIIVPGDDAQNIAARSARAAQPSLPGRMMKSFLRMVFLLIGLTALGYLLFLLLVYFSQSRMLYLPGLPERTPRHDPGDIGLDFDDVKLTTADGERIHGWLVKTARARGTLLFFHGNAGNVGHRLDSIRIFTDLGLDVFIIDYRGYGMSTGSPDEAGTYRDAEAAWRWLTGERAVTPERIVLFGRSLGAAVALDLAVKVPAAGLILESAFTSVPDRAAELYPLLPVRMLARYRYDNLAKIPGLSMPLLLVHARQDRVIPFAHGRRLFQAAPGPKRFLTLNGGHNDGFLRSKGDYRRGLDAFLREQVFCVPRESGPARGNADHAYLSRSAAVTLWAE